MKHLVIEKVEIGNAQLFRREVYIASMIHPRDSGERLEAEVRTTPVGGVKNGKPAEFDSPIVLCTAPKGSAMSGVLTVMESDADFRRVGSIMATMRERLKGTRVANRLAQAGTLGSSGSAVVLIRAALGLVIGRLQKAGDDVLAEIEVNIEAGDSGEVKLSGQKAAVTLRVVDAAEFGKKGSDLAKKLTKKGKKAAKAKAEDAVSAFDPDVDTSEITTTDQAPASETSE